MASIVVAGDTSGTVTLAAPAVSGTTTLTLPTTSGTIVTTATSSGISGSAITTGTVATNVGGTGLTTYTQGDLVYASATNTLGRLADVATGNALISGGVGADPAWGKIGLTTHVDGTLPVANGGTGTTTPSLVGGTNITISGAWPNQTVTAAGGGVTSLNGQTGAITNTGFGDIGSYVVASSNAFAMNTRYNGGETFAGSSLDRDNQNAGATNTIGSLSGTAGSSPWAVTAPTNTGLASMGLSGTWRVMCGIQNGNISNINRRALALFVRIS